MTHTIHAIGRHWCDIIGHFLVTVYWSLETDLSSPYTPWQTVYFPRLISPVGFRSPPPPRHWPWCNKWGAKVEWNWSGQEDVLWRNIQWNLYIKTTPGTNKYGPYTEMVFTHRFNNTYGIPLEIYKLWSLKTAALYIQVVFRAGSTALPNVYFFCKYMYECSCSYSYFFT